jgi:hypothetical protein
VPPEEVIMVATVKKAGTQFSQWFKAFREKNRPPYKYYEYDVDAG